MTSKTKTDLDDRIVALLHKPIFYSLFFIGISIAVQLISFSDAISHPNLNVPNEYIFVNEFIEIQCCPN